MPARLADVKKTVRARQGGERYLHLRLLDERAATQVDLVLAFLNAHLGRRRHEVDPDVVTRLFGDAKTARGVVACVDTIYRWRVPRFADVLEPAALAHLEAKGLTGPSDLRLYLFDTVNAAHGGFLPLDRDTHLAPIARKLRLRNATLDQLVALDAAENQVLVRAGDAPTAADVIARYNFNAVDAALRASKELLLDDLSGSERDALGAACASQRVRFSVQGSSACIHNEPDAFGNYARGGGRVVAALYAALARAPGLLRSCVARVKLPSGVALFELKPAVLTALTGGSSAILRGEPVDGLRDQWERLRASGETCGWRLRVQCEPLLSRAGLVLPAYTCLREELEVLIWPISDGDTLRQAQAIYDAGVPIVGVPAAGFTIDADCEPSLPLVDSGAGLATLPLALDRRYGATRADAAQQALSVLLGEVAEQGFVAEDQVVAALGCASIADIERRLRDVVPDRVVYLPGLGVCTPDFADGVRNGLRRARRRAGRSAA